MLHYVECASLYSFNDVVKGYMKITLKGERRVICLEMAFYNLDIRVKCESWI